MNWGYSLRNGAGAAWVLLVAIGGVQSQSGTVPVLSLEVSDQQVLVISWPVGAAPMILEQSATLVSGSWHAVMQPAARQGDEMVLTLNPTDSAQFYRLRGVAVSGAFTVSGVSPSPGAREIGLTVHPMISFTRPVNILTLHTNNLYATAAGVPLVATIVPGKDGLFAWLFFKTPMPGGTRIRVSVDGTDILAADAPDALDADGDGAPGGVMNYEFTTVSQAPIPGTILAGIVVDPGPDLIPRTADDWQPGPDGKAGTGDDLYRLPIQGVRVSILGQTSIQTTGADGRFRFEAVPVGDIKVVVDGTAASQVPSGLYFPEMVLDAQMALGQENWAMASGSEVYLPRLARSILQTINPDTTNLVKALPEGSQGLSAFQRNQLSIEVPPSSFIGPDGRVMTGGELGVSTVPPETVRDMLPEGILQHTFDITVQAPGVTRLSTPAPMSFPNIFNALPGTQLNFLSFDHTTGRLVIDGTATVSEDGASVRTDPGTGITRPGWHGLAPPGGPNDPPCPPDQPRTLDVAPDPLAVIVLGGAAREFGSEPLLFKDDEDFGGHFVLSFGNAAPKLGPGDPCSPENAVATPLLVVLELDDAAAGKFLDGLSLQTFELLPGQTRNIPVKLRSLLGSIRNDPEFGQDHFFGIQIRAEYYRVTTTGGITPLLESPPPQFIYRYADASDSQHWDGLIEFPDTLADGPGNVIRTRIFKLDTSADSTPVLRVRDARHLSITTNAFVFDPRSVADEITEPLVLTAPDGHAVTTHSLTLKGRGTPKFKIVANTAGLKSVLQQISDSQPSPQAVRMLSKTSDGAEGYFTLSFAHPEGAESKSTVVLPYSAPAEMIQSALWDLPNIGASNVVVTREDFSVTGEEAQYAARIQVQFQGRFQGTAVPLLVLETTGGRLVQLSNQQQNVVVRTRWPHTLTTRFSLEFATNALTDWVSTGDLTVGATALQLQRALEALPGIGPGNVEVSRAETNEVSGSRLSETTYFIVFKGMLAGTKILPLRVHTSNAIVDGTTSTLVDHRLLTPNVLALFDTDEKRQGIAEGVVSNLVARFSVLSTGVEVVDEPAADAATLMWTLGADKGIFGNSGNIPGGSGVDDRSAITNLVQMFKAAEGGSATYYNFLLAQSLNRVFSAAVEIYPNTILGEKQLAPFEPTRQEFIHTLGHVAAHEVAHTLGATHTAQGYESETNVNQIQVLTLSGGADADTYRLELSGLITAPIRFDAPALQVARGLESTGLFRPPYDDASGRHPGDLKVTGNAHGPYQIEFGGTFSGSEFPLLSVREATGSLNGSVDEERGGIYLPITKGIVKIGEPLSDVMSGGSFDPTFSAHFQPGLSLDVLRLGLKLGWSKEEAQKALAFFIGYVNEGSFHGIGDADRDRLPIIPGPRLALKADGRLVLQSLAFGIVPADGPGGSNQTIRLEVANLGDTSTVLRQASVGDPGGPFRVGATSRDLVLKRGQPEVIEVVFDPLTGGEHSGELLLETSDPGASVRLGLVGTGRASGPDLRTVVHASNLGSAAVGQAPRVVTHAASLRNIGSQPLWIQDLKVATAGSGQFRLINLPENFGPSHPIVISEGAAYDLGISFAPAKAGLQRTTIEIASNDPKVPLARFAVVGTGLAASALPRADYGNDFVALESPDFPNSPILRAQTDAEGRFEFFLPPEQRYHGIFFDPISGLVAHVYGITAPSGQNTSFGIPVFGASTSPDTDGDGLPDDAEFAVGTHPNRPDTDGNGVDDFTEVTQGRNPLGGRSAATGIIGRVQTGGSARNVTLVAPERGNPNVLHAYVSAGDLVIVDVSQPALPVLLGKLDWPRSVVDAAVDTDLRLATVAASVNAAVSTTGLFLVDVADPVRPRVVKSFDVQATEVESVDGFAYAVSTGGGLQATMRSIDLVTQQAVGEIQLPILALHCMAREANFLYALGDRTLCIVSVASGEMRLRGTLAIPGATGRFSVSDGIAYVPMNGPIVIGGYATVDVKDPDAPRLIQPAMTPTGVSAPSGIAALTGSGLLLLGGLAAGFAGYAVDLMDASEPTNTYRFNTRFQLPSLPLAIVPAAGYAFIATHDQELLILNYLQLDTLGQAPDILEVEVLSDAGSAGPERPVIEGHEFHVRAALADDVQVHSVELLLNGQVAQRSISFPFNLSGIVPDLSPQSSNIVVQVRATDTGGNARLSEPVIAQIVHDPVPPVLLQLDPAENEKKGRGFHQARMVFSKPMAQSATDLGNFQVARLDGAHVRLVSSSLVDKNRTVELDFQPLEAGDYQLTARTAQIKDRAGNASSTTDLVRRFSVDEYSIRWIRTNAGSWFQPTNWIPARVPEPDDTVLIDVADAVAPVHIVGRPGWHVAGIRQPISIRKLVSNEPVLLSVVDLHAVESVRVNNTLHCYYSGLTNTTWIADSNTVVNGPPLTAGLRLVKVIMEGDFLMSDRGYAFSEFMSAPLLELRGSFTLNGSLSAEFANDNGVPHAVPITVPYSLMLGGVGTIHHPSFDAGLPRLTTDPLPVSPEIVIGPGLTFRGHQSLTAGGHETRLINRGRLIFDYPFSLQRRDLRSYIFQSYTNQFINENTIEVRNGARLDLNGVYFSRFINQGTWKATDGAYLYISGPWISPKIFCDTGAVCDIDGNLLTAPGQVSELSGPGRWLAGRNAQLTGGTVRLTQGAALEGSVKFNEVVFEGDLHNYDPNARKPQLPELFFGYSHQVVVLTNLTLNGSIIFHRQPTDTVVAQMVWSAGQHRFDGRGRIVFEAASYPSQFGAGGSDVTIGPDITIEANGVILGTARQFGSGPFANMHNLGTILADQPGHGVQLGCFNFTNSGTIRIGSSLILTNYYHFLQTASGRLVLGAAGTEPGVSHGQLMNFGQATLDGSITLEPTAQFRPQAGDVYELVGYRQHQGAFASYFAPPPPAGLAWQPLYGPTSFQLQLAGSSGPGLGMDDRSDAFTALRLDGAGDYVQVSHAAALNAYPLTAMAWIKTDRNASQVDGLVTKYADGSADGYALVLSEGHLRAWYLRDPSRGVGLTSALDGGFIADGQWHHLALVVDRSGGILYVDGIRRAEQGWKGTTPGDASVDGPTASSEPLQFGRFDQYDHGLAGDLDEVVLVNAALSDHEVQLWTNRQRGVTDDSRIIGLWHFDEGVGTTAGSSSGPDHTATLAGDAKWIDSDFR